jgi:hypothetical protein
MRDEGDGFWERERERGQRRWEDVYGEGEREEERKKEKRKKIRKKKNNKIR